MQAFKQDIHYFGAHLNLKHATLIFIARSGGVHKQPAPCLLLYFPVAVYTRQYGSGTNSHIHFFSLLEHRTHKVLHWDALPLVSGRSNYCPYGQRHYHVPRSGMAAAQVGLRSRERKNDFQECCFRPTPVKNFKSLVPERPGVFLVSLTLYLYPKATSLTEPNGP